ncbi:MAG: prepilin-type N-terminal cleavage/methylation domain-containing protein [Deltaproteobacteria bacterium]
MTATQEQSGIKQIKNNKGFTLIEMAIVLVIIGIIIGAVVKGQDLVANAQAKQLTSAINTWRSLAFAYLDRNGRFPGDISRSGIIGDSASNEQVDGGTAIDELVSTMNNAPPNPISIGSMSFWVYFGNVTAAVGKRNAIVICKTANCAAATLFNKDELEIIKSIDTALDGVADAGVGQIRAAATVTMVGGLTANNGRTNDVVKASTVVDNTITGTATLWDTTAHFAAIWAFDRPF